LEEPVPFNFQVEKNVPWESEGMDTRKEGKEMGLQAAHMLHGIMSQKRVILYRIYT
jgi:hypothetical protein